MRGGENVSETKIFLKIFILFIYFKYSFLLLFLFLLVLCVCVALMNNKDLSDLILPTRAA